MKGLIYVTVWYSFLWWIRLAKDCGTNLNNNKISKIHKLPHSLKDLEGSGGEGGGRGDRDGEHM